LRRTVLVVVAALVASCAGSAVASAATPEQRMLGAINDSRHDQGLRDLRAAPELARSAGAFARFLVRHDQFSHRPRVSVSRSYPHCGEALAMHFSLAAQVGVTLRSWLASPVHRGLVMTRSMNLVGVGHASGRVGGKPKTVWVMQVAARRR
jgi:uncharacterized protein YkwD